MVLWEITLATAYWLGIRKTYRLALQLQRRLIGPQHPRIRDFMHRRTRNVFDVALTVHKKIQSRDLSAGRSLGNFILRFLDHARPSAKIRGPPPGHGENPGQKNLSTGSRSSDKGRTDKQSPEKNSSKSSMGSDRLLFSQYIHKASFVQAISNRFSVGMGRRYPGIHVTKSISEHRPCTMAGSAREDSGSPFPSSWLGSPFVKGVFRSDITQLIGEREAMNSTAF